MSYEIMEARLVEGILELRTCEDALVRSYAQLRSKPDGPAAAAMNQEFTRIQMRLAELDQLMAQLDAAETSSQAANLSFIPKSNGSAPSRPAYQA
jgi:hypothetical protein